jgi:hypothetical protein
VLPSKPVKTVFVHGIFRGRTGIAWFDDFKLRVLRLPDGIKQFDGVPVSASFPGAGRGNPGPSLKTSGGLVVAASGCIRA